MRTSRAADNELYDRGCDLVEAATAIRRAAASPEAARAVPAVLGCVESALEQLVRAAAALEDTTGDANLQRTLSDAQRAASAARARASRALFGRSA